VGYVNRGATLTTNANGALNFDRFAFGGVGQDVWVVVQTPNGQVESNHFRWKNG